MTLERQVTATTAASGSDTERAEAVRKIVKVELHQNVDGSVPVEITWQLMKEHKLNPVETIEEMTKLLVLQKEEEGAGLLKYLDKFHYPLWVTQFYENISEVVYRIAR